MTIEGQVHAIQALGYSRSEAQFLRLVALHSGYFVRRQFLRWLGRGRGKRSQAFIQQLISRGHACREIFRQDRHLFRLQSKAIYEAAGDENNRNRREHQSSTVRLRLMGLDFIVENREHCYLTSQREKLAYFNEQRGIDVQVLPARSYRSKDAITTHYFPEAFPLFVDRENAQFVSFVYVDDTRLSSDAFKSYLQSYTELFQVLKSLNLIFLTQLPARFAMAQRALERFSRRHWDYLEGNVDLHRLLSHFPHRLLYEKRVTRSLNTAEMMTLQRDIHELVGSRIDSLYAVWKESGNEGLRAEWAAQNQAVASPEIKLTSCILDYDYDLFGTLRTEL